MIFRKIFFVFIVCFSFSACNHIDVREWELTESLESEHFVYHYHPNDTVEIDLERQGQYFEWLCSTLPNSLDDKIHFYKYLDRTHLNKINDRKVNAFAESDKIRLHAIWPIDNPECVHILINNQFGFGPAIFDEGIAVAHQVSYLDTLFAPNWNGNDFHQIGK